jgi:hypothetical protein
VRVEHMPAAADVSEGGADVMGEAAAAPPLSPFLQHARIVGAAVAASPKRKGPLFGTDDDGERGGSGGVAAAQMDATAASVPAGSSALSNQSEGATASEGSASVPGAGEAAAASNPLALPQRRQKPTEGAAEEGIQPSDAPDGRVPRASSGALDREAREDQAHRLKSAMMQAVGAPMFGQARGV